MKNPTELAKRWLATGKGAGGPKIGDLFEMNFSDGVELITEDEMQAMALEVERLKPRRDSRQPYPSH